jgi:signal transduction histidine kinase
MMTVLTGAAVQTAFSAEAKIKGRKILPSPGDVSRHLPIAFFPPKMLGWLRTLMIEGHEDTARSLVVRFGFTLVCVTAALSLTLLMQQVGSGRPSLFLFFAAIVASAWFGGPSTGIAAVLLSLPAGLYFYWAELGFIAYGADNLFLFLIFVLCAMAGGQLGAWRRRADNALALKAHQLQQANDALRAEINERRRTEQALQEAQAELARASRLTTMGELAATIAHEINQPLAAISNSAGACVRWLNANPPNLQEARLSANWIVRDSARAAAVVSRIRAMVRNAMADKAPVSVNRVIEDVLRSIGYDLRKHRVSVKLALDPSAPRLLADRVQLQQVFLNIFMNAMEAMAQTKAKERNLTISTAARGDEVRISVEDSGGGFEGESEAIFQPFFTTKPAGMGLGLSICRSIVEAHGGELKAVAGIGGACFRLAMPKLE